MATDEYTPTRWGNLTQTGLVEWRRDIERSTAYVPCVCDCGRERTPRLVDLERGRTKSCGRCRRTGKAAHRGPIPKPKDTSSEPVGRPTASGRFCHRCFGLPHRRPRQGLCVCGDVHEALPALDSRMYLSRTEDPFVRVVAEGSPTRGR